VPRVGLIDLRETPSSIARLRAPRPRRAAPFGVPLEGWDGTEEARISGDGRIGLFLVVRRRTLDDTFVNAVGGRGSKSLLGDHGAEQLQSLGRTASRFDAAFPHRGVLERHPHPAVAMSQYQFGAHGSRFEEGGSHDHAGCGASMSDAERFGRVGGDGGQGGDFGGGEAGGAIGGGGGREDAMGVRDRFRFGVGLK